MPRRLATVALFTTALILSACDAPSSSGHDGHGEAPPVAEGARRIELEASAFAFSPARLDLDAGEDVALAMTSTDVAHDVVIDAVGFHLTADPGHTAEGGLRIDQPGTYVAYCSVNGHREAGMQATIVVRG